MEPLGLGAMEMFLIFEMSSNLIAEVAPFLYLNGSYSGGPEVHSLAVILVQMHPETGSGKSKSTATLHSSRLQSSQEETKGEVGACSPFTAHLLRCIWIHR